MEFVILAVVVLGVAGILVWLTKSGGKLINERNKKLKKAEAGKAKVLAFKSVGFRGTGEQGEFQAYTFSLEVSSAYKAPYNTDTVWNVYPMGAPKVQVGAEVNVKIDADDPDIVYPDVDAVEYSWSAAIMLRAHRSH
jgi:hypothetical protein